VIYNATVRISVVTTGGARAPEVIDLHPTKIVCIGANYRAHVAEMGKKVPEEPVLFMKPPSALVATGAPILRPRGYQRVDFEGELAMIVARRARRVPAADALEVLLGLTVVNDVTVRDLQQKDGQWTRAKGFDTFCPLGPQIVAGVDPADLRITTRVNGEIRQDSRTSDLIFPVPFLIEFISRHMTLEAGDVISTGTPAGVGNLAPGDRVAIEIEGIGTLENPVIDEPGEPSA
jgi:2-keto-4-pentenoate hydratase/2-oxohepta-3-ene-1,7-dioic acid hydratase in catechol pathway